MSAALRPRPATSVVPTAEMLAIVREYVEAGRLDGADRLLAHILDGDPRQPDALHLAGFVAFKRGRAVQAAELMERGRAVGAGSVRHLCNLAEVYRHLGRIDDGLTVARRAADLAPTDPVAHFNTAMLLYEAQEAVLCMMAARRAVALKPDMAEAHMRLGQTLLLTGQFAEGWAEYEWRYGIAGAQPLMPPAFVARGTRPQWDGAPLAAGQRLFLIADQGFGDVLMFARWLPWAMARAADIVVACSADLSGLLARVFPGPTYIETWDHVGRYDAYCPFSGLPRLAQITVEDLRGDAPYVTADPARVATTRAWLDQACPGDRPRVGLVWAGRPTHNNDRNRSMPLDTLAPLAAVPGVRFVSMQKGPAASQVAGWPGSTPLLDAGARLATFEDTAALVACLDLVIAVDTSVNHLAGAMGKTAWVLIPFAADWRWLRGRMHSPWYDGVRLYRQADRGDWAPVIERMAEELAARFS